MTLRECAIIEAYTGICMCAGERRKEFYKYAAEIMGRPVYTHEFADKKIQNEITEKSKPDFIKLCKEAINDKGYYYVRGYCNNWDVYFNPAQDYGKMTEAEFLEDLEKHILIQTFYCEDIAKRTADELNAKRVLKQVDN